MRLWHLLGIATLEYSGVVSDEEIGCILQDEEQARKRVRENPLGYGFFLSLGKKRRSRRQRRAG